jgi:hypothetical protein
MALMGRSPLVFFLAVEVIIGSLLSNTTEARLHAHPRHLGQFGTAIDTLGRFETAVYQGL